jgi:hypothetical protein
MGLGISPEGDKMNRQQAIEQAADELLIEINALGVAPPQKLTALEKALALPNDTAEPVGKIQELESLVKAQQNAFDIENNRIAHAQHVVFHKSLIRDAIKKINECKGRPYSAWDIWLIDAKCMLERVLREWPAPQEVAFTNQPKDTAERVALVADIDAWLYNLGKEECGNTMLFRRIRAYLTSDRQKDGS